MEMDKDALADVVVRLRRAQGQIGGVIQMIENGRDHEDVIIQLAAASRALDKAGFRIIAVGLEQCLLSGEPDPARTGFDRARLEKLFLSLA